MKKIATIAGALTMMGGFMYGCANYATNFLPSEYEVSERRDAEVIYNRDGEVYVHSDPKDMLQYLMKEDSRELEQAISDLEKEVENDQ